MPPLATNVIRHTPLVDALEERLQAQVPGVEHYLTEAKDVPLAPGGGGRVARYYILHPFGGGLSPERALAEGGVDKEWTVQVTCAAGTPRDALVVATLIDAAMHLWVPTFPTQGWVAGWFKPPEGFDAGPVQVDRDYQPHRYYLPLQYQTTITAN